MIEAWLVILIHQIVFQGMFVIKNIVLEKKLGKPIRGNNREANFSIALIILFITVSLVISILRLPIGEAQVLGDPLSMIIGLVLLLLNLTISAASLLNLKDSWRVGILKDQNTELISSGIYRFTRNPYFLSYMIMFIAYTVILQNIMLIVLTVFAFLLIHKMILKEEEYLYSVHGADYVQYKQKVPRYLLI